MNLNSRVRQLLERVVPVVRRKRLRATMTNCEALDVHQLMDVVARAVDRADEDVFKDLIAQADATLDLPPRPLPGGGFACDWHGFIEWLCALKDGWALLPAVIPRDVLLAWRDGHAQFPVGPFCRCHDCWMVLPNATPGGVPRRWFKACPVCNSERLCWADIAHWPGAFHPWGTKMMTGVEN
jgi:hypothetical protein